MHFLEQEYECPYCGAQTTNEICCDRCREELRQMINRRSGHTPWCDRFTAPFYYSGFVRDAICRFKFCNQLNYLEPFANAMALCVDEPADVVIPVPVYEGERACNVADLLAKAVAQRTGQHHSSRAIIKTRSTKFQHDLPLKEKFHNIKDCYRAFPKKLTGKTVLVCDDIITSANTINEMAKACKQAGARRVFALSIAVSKVVFEIDFSLFD